MAQPATSRMSTVGRVLPWLSGLVLIAGVVAFLVVKLGGNDSSPSANPSPPVQQSPPASVSPPAVTPPGAGKTSASTQKQRAARFDSKAREVAGKFILTAVQRKHLARAWPLAGPAIRQDSTYKEWLTGNIAVVPYLDPIVGAKFSVDRVAANSVDITVALAPKGVKKRISFFRMTLVQVGKGAKRHWIVNDWAPRYQIGVPSGGGGSS